jgi:uncharacterized membrane protein YhaH (DUF805 family)
MLNNNIFSCKGEITRLSFIVTTLLMVIPAIFLEAIGNALLKTDAVVSLLVIAVLQILLGVLVIFAAAKRYRNLGKNPYLSLLMLIPLVSRIVWFYLAIKPQSQTRMQIGN